MNLRKKKELAAKTLGVGKHRIAFNQSAHAEIKEAITKEDIRTLHQENLIMIKPVKGRKTNVKRKTRRGPGKIKIKVKHRKRDYVIMTRKLRSHIKELKNRGQITPELYADIRKKIKMRYFKSKAYLVDYIKKSGTVIDVIKAKKVKGRISVKRGPKKVGKK